MSKQTLVINLIGGPGCGKSTTMAGVFYRLKKLGINCEMATEFTKEKVWDEDYRMLDDQLYIVTKQMHRISRLIGKVDIVIMDTSLLSSIIYDKQKSEMMKQLCIESFNKFNNMVFFIDRSDIKYHTEGRVETYERSKEIDDAYRNLMAEYNIPYTEVTNENCVDVILEQLKNAGYLE